MACEDYMVARCVVWGVNALILCVCNWMGLKECIHL